MNYSLSILIKALDQASSPIRHVTTALSNMHKQEIAAQRAEQQSMRQRYSSYMQMNRARREQMRGEMMDAAGMAYALSSPIRSAMRFESAMADVRKVVDFDAPDGLKQMGQTIKGLSKTIPLTQQGLAQIVANGGQMGIANKNLAEFTNISAQMAVAFDMTADAAGNTSGKIKNIFGLDTLSQVRSLGDAVNHLSNNTASTASEIMDANMRAGGMARTFGLSAVQTSALSSSFIALGKRPEVAGTAINAMLMKMQAASMQGKKFQSALKYMGTSAEELEKSISQNAQGALVDFLGLLEKKSPEERSKVLSALFGLEYADDLSLLVGSLDKYRDALSLVADEQQYAGSMTKEFQERINTTSGKIALAKNRFNNFAINLGTAVLPAINNVLVGLNWFSDSLAFLTETYPRLTQVVTTAVAGLVAFRVASLAASYSAKVLAGSIMSTMFAGMKLLPVLKAVGVFMMANPILAGATVIASAAYLIYRNWDWLKQKFADIWGWITDKISAVANLVPNWMKNLFGSDGSDVAQKVEETQSIATGAPLPSPTANSTALGGELTVRIESEAPVRVTNAETTPNFGIDVLSGQTMVTP